MENETQTQEQQTSYEESTDYSQPLFERKSISIYSFISAILFIVAGVVAILTDMANHPIKIGAVLMIIGIVLLIRNILKMRGIGF